jgi:thiamine kinase-like enzyme
VLRIPLHPWKNHIDRCREYVNLQSIAPLHLMPATLYFDSKTGIQLRNYIEGKVLAQEPMTEALAGDCAILLHRLHDSAVQFEPIDMIERLFEDWSNLLADGLILDPRYEALFAYCDRVRGLLVCAQSVPCHMDPNVFNFIAGERLWMIDFEYAHQYDPAWDLAYFIAGAKLTPAQTEAFHLAYGTDTEMMKRVDFFKPITQLSQAIWVQQHMSWGQTPVDTPTLIDWEQNVLQYAMELIDHMLLH